MVTTLLLNLFVVYSCHWGPWNLKSIYTMVPLLVQNKNKTCSVDTASWALDNPLWHSHDVRNNGIPRNRSNASLITKGDQELTWQYPLSKFHSKQARVLLCKSILHFTMGFYGSPCDYTQNHCLSILYVTTSRASLITSFQPLVQIYTPENSPSFSLAFHNTKQSFTNIEYNFIPRTLM